MSIVLLVGLCLAGSDRVEARLRSLSLEQRVGQMILACPQLDRSRPLEVGGVLFSGARYRNAPERVAGIVAWARASAEVPPLFAMDLEGGEVNPLSELERLPPPSVLALRTDAEVESWGFRTGTALLGVGVNLDLAPVLDVGSQGHMAEFGRTFGSDPVLVAARGRAFVRGLHRAGVGTVSKHFPGYGSLGRSSDHALLEGRFDRAQAAVFAEVPTMGVMMSSVAYPELGGRPAVFVPELVDRARREPGVVVVTDDLATAPLLEWAGSPREVVRAAVLAGNDLLVWSAPLDWERGTDIRAVLLDLVRGDAELEARVETSVRRVLGLKEALGLLEPAPG